MRLVSAIACWIVAIGCALRARGAEQQLFAAEHVWAWWPIAGWWFVAGLVVLARGAR